MTRFAVVFQEQRSEHDYYDPQHPSTVTVNAFKDFDTESLLLEWIESNDRYGRKTFKAYKLEELVVSRSVSVVSLSSK